MPALAFGDTAPDVTAVIIDGEISVAGGSSPDGVVRPRPGAVVEDRASTGT